MEQQSDLDVKNIDSHTRQYFNSIDNGSDAIEYYNYVLNGQPVDYVLSDEFKNEIENLDISLQNADFENLNEFEDYVMNYTPIYITNSIELKGWSYYTDILTHSVSYWATNIDKWDNLIDTPVTLADKQPCKEGDWWKRTWCNVKRYGAKDAGAGATKIVVLLLESSAIVFGPVAGAALGASVGAILVDLIFLNYEVYIFIFIYNTIYQRKFTNH